MQNSRDSSVWRTLAVAFGDGLAFGVGVTLTRGAARLAASRSTTPEENGWSKELEQRGGRDNGTGAAARPAAPAAKAEDRLLPAIDKRITEVGGRIERRLAGLGSQLQEELDALDAQDHELAEGVEARIELLRGEIAAAVGAQRQGIEADMRGLRAQMTAVHKEFAETLARLMDEQISQTIAARMSVMEKELRETIHAEVHAEIRASDEVRDQVRDKGLQEQAEQIAELRGLMESQERNVRGLVMALGQSCLQAMEAIPSPPAEAGVEAVPLTSEQSAEAATDADLPGFARTRPRKPLWRVPIVPSFLAATGSLLLLHYL